MSDRNQMIKCCRAVVLKRGRAQKCSGSIVKHTGLLVQFLISVETQPLWCLHALWSAPMISLISVHHYGDVHVQACDFVHTHIQYMWVYKHYHNNKAFDFTYTCIKVWNNVFALFFIFTMLTFSFLTLNWTELLKPTNCCHNSPFIPHEPPC